MTVIKVINRTIISGQAINEKAEAALEEAIPKRDRKFPVVEMFGPTIQGEGAMLGEQTMFIRFGGCDFRCTLCDSLHAVLPEEVKKNSIRMTTSEIITALMASERVATWVTLSGGNPVMHDLDNLVDNLHDVGRKIAVETQGSLWADWLLKCDHVTVSPKGPGMGEEFSAEDFQVYVDKLSRKALGFPVTDWSVKVVIMNQVDIEFAKGLLGRWPQIRQRFYLSLGNPFPPQINDGKGLSAKEIRPLLLDHYTQLVEDILQEPFLHDCKVTPQLHVLFWGNARGV